MAFQMVNSNGNKNVTAQQDADLFSGTFGNSAVVLPVGEQCRAEIIDSNTIRVYDGEFISQGRRFNQAYGEYQDFEVDNGSHGTIRYDILGMRFYVDASGKDLHEPFVKKDVGENGTITENSIREGATESYISMYRVKINGLSIESVEPLFSIVNPIAELLRQAVLAAHPIDTIYVSVSPVNPSKYFGGTWIQWGKGRVPVGVDASQTDFNTVEKTGGQKTADLQHSHTVNDHKHISPFGYDDNCYYSARQYGSVVVGANPGYYLNGGNGGKTGQVRLNYTSSSSPGTDSKLSKQSLLQPYITCYMWKRVA